MEWIRCIISIVYKWSFFMYEPAFESIRKKMEEIVVEDKQK